MASPHRSRMPENDLRLASMAQQVQCLMELGLTLSRKTEKSKKSCPGWACDYRLGPCQELPSKPFLCDLRA